jgi:hypothetical protein
MRFVHQYQTPRHVLPHLFYLALPLLGARYHRSTLDARCSMLDARCSMLDARCSMLDARCSMLDARCSMLDARTRRLVYGVAAKSRFPHCAYQRSENTAKLQETCTRPICMHAKTVVTSVTCGIRGRRFYLALLPVVFRCPPKSALGGVQSPKNAGSDDALRRMSRGPGATAKMLTSVLRFEPRVWKAPHPICTL